MVADVIGSLAMLNLADDEVDELLEINANNEIEVNLIIKKFVISEFNNNSEIFKVKFKSALKYLEVTQLKRYLIKIKNESCKMHCRELN